MNFAFASILIFVILSPGLLFRNSYLSENFSKKYISNQLIDEIAWAIIPGIAFNIGGYFIVNSFTSYKIDLRTIGFLLTNINDKKIIGRIFNDINSNLIPIALYFLTLWGIAMLLGHLSRKIIRWGKWDKKYQLFRFANEWYYFFRGDYLDIPGDEEADIDFIVSEVLVDVGSGKHMLYVGFVRDFFMSKDGGLESIYLQYPLRKEYDNPKYTEGREIGNLLMIPFSTVINIGLKYMKIVGEIEIEVPEVSRNPRRRGRQNTRTRYLTRVMS